MFVNTMNQVVFLLVCSVSEEEEMEEEEQEEEQGLRVAYFRGPEGVCGGEVGRCYDDARQGHMVRRRVRHTGTQS